MEEFFFFFYQLFKEVCNLVLIVKLLIIINSEKMFYIIYLFSFVVVARYGYMSFLRGSANKAVFFSGRDYIYVPKEDFEFLGGLWEDKIASIDCEKREFCYMKNTTCADLY